MPNPSDIDATIEAVLQRIKQIPDRLEAPLKAFEEKARAALHELNAASTLADVIVDNATKTAAI